MAPAVGVRVPAAVRGVPEPDRAVVEGAQVTGAEGQGVHDVGRGVRRGRRGDGLLERSPAPVRLGPPAAPPAETEAGGGTRALRHVTCRMHHIKGTSHSGQTMMRDQTARKLIWISLL